MVKLHSAKWDKDAPLLLIVTADERLGHGLNAWLEQNGARGVWVKSAKEAEEVLDDASFIGIQFQGVLANYEHNLGSGI